MACPPVLRSCQRASRYLCSTMPFCGISVNRGVVSYTIIAYVNTIVVMSMAGIAQGIQPLISFHYGRQERDVCSRLLKYSLTASVGVAGIAFLSSMAGADRLVDIFYL